MQIDPDSTTISAKNSKIAEKLAGTATDVEKVIAIAQSLGEATSTKQLRNIAT